MAPRIDIGIDGGGTGCRVAISVEGRVTETTGGAANVVTDPAGPRPRSARRSWRAFPTTTSPSTT
jgi:N-acetylglucosamine kinase-like BadF-type ATPase